MSHGFPDWGNLATSGASEIPSYRLSQGIGFQAGDDTKVVLSSFNPAASNTLAKLRRVLVFIEYSILADGAGSHVVHLWRTSSLGSGDAIVPVKHSTTDPPSVMTTIDVVTTLPTLTDHLSEVALSYERKTALQPSRFGLPVFAGILYEQSPAGQTKALQFVPGQGFAVQITDPVVDGILVFIPEWTEEPYS